MGKDARLVEIYLKIHHKRAITLDDLAYLAKYAPECFEKTCEHLVGKFPETKPIMESPVTEPIKEETETALPEQLNIKRILNNLRRMEANEYYVNNVDVNEVKNLLGNLYMELLLLHSDKETFMSMAGNSETSLFDKKI